MTTDEIQELTQEQRSEMVATLNYNQLHDLRVHVTERMRSMRENGVEQMRLKFIEDAAALGLAPEDIFGAPKKQRRKRRRKDDDPDGPAA